MTPATLVGAARVLLDRPHRATAGVWPRAAAFLARQALEQAVDDLWRRTPRMAALVGCPMATQLLCLPLVLDRRTAQNVAYTWSALSRACHYHPYELSPTATELAGWCASVDQLVASLECAQEEVER